MLAFQQRLRPVVLLFEVDSGGEDAGQDGVVGISEKIALYYFMGMVFFAYSLEEITKGAVAEAGSVGMLIDFSEQAGKLGLLGHVIKAIV